MSALAVAVILVVIAYLSYNFVTGKPPNAPPGIPRLPFFGSYLHLLWGDYTFPHKTFKYYVQKYKSKLISCYIGDFFTVIAHDYKTIKEILTRDEFDGRVTEIDVVKARAFGKTLGIFFNDGSHWREQRRFSLRNLRDFGFGRRFDKLETEIMVEMKELIEFIKNGPINDDEKKILKGVTALFPDVLYAAAGNSIWYIMSGEKLERSEHEKLRENSRSILLFVRSTEATGGAIAIFPWLKYFGDWFKYKSILKGSDGLTNFVKAKVQERKTTSSENLDRGFMDRYFEVLKENEKHFSYSEEQMIMGIADIMIPALTTLPIIITHAIKYIIHNPRVAKKVQEEIDRVVGTGRMVTWDDRNNLPYTEATLREVNRIETATPLSVIHRCLKTTTLNGYTIPANTVVITNLSYMHEDPDVWGDPENFRPERFLSESGELVKDFSLPFGFGHRVCAGETYARLNLFGFFANLMQTFDFHSIEGEPTSIDDKLPGIVTSPKETWIRVIPRS